VIDLVELEKLSRQYNTRLDEFIANNSLPESWFDAGYDHVAVKAFNLEEYEEIIESFKPVSDRITEIDMDGRQIATATLLGSLALEMSLSLGDYIYVRNVEIMLARPDDQGIDSPRFDHSEIFMPRGLIPVAKILDIKGIDFFDEENQSHSWISVAFNDGQDEIKFTDRRLGDINEEEIASGNSRVIHEARL
jgi:hypothetical protein